MMAEKNLNSLIFYLMAIYSSICINGSFTCAEYLFNHCIHVLNTNSTAKEFYKGVKKATKSANLKQKYQIHTSKVTIPKMDVTLVTFSIQCFNKSFEVSP